MSNRNPTPLALIVEGLDDKNSIIHLLIRNGIPFNLQSRPDYLPELREAKTVGQLIADIGPALKAVTPNTVGFVLDADTHPNDRWQAIRNRLIEVGVVDVPEALPTAGFIGELPEFQVRVGVWLMPDNVREGKLEDFLRELVPPGDPIIGHAESSTAEAKQLGAKFSDLDMIKAVMHTWLAWQKDPGKPFGVALKAEFFSHDTEIALQFVRWFRELYHITA